MLGRVARSSKKDPPGKSRRRSEGLEVKSGRELTGKLLGGERGVSRAWRPARDWGAGKTAAAPAFARPRAARHGPPLTDASLPFRPGDRARGPDCPRRPPRSGIGVSVAAPPAAYLRPSARIRGLRDSFPPGPSARPRRPASHPPPLPAPGTGGGRRGRGRVVECETQRRDSAALSRRRHWALRHGAGLASSAGRGGRRAAGARRRDTAALRPAGEEQPRSNQPREGGWAAEWGGVSGSREWLPRRPGGSLLSASPTHAGSRPRPLARPRAPLGRVGPPRRAGPGDPCPRALPPLPLPTESGSRPGRFCRI